MKVQERKDRIRGLVVFSKAVGTLGDVSQMGVGGLAAMGVREMFGGDVENFVGSEVGWGLIALSRITAFVHGVVGGDSREILGNMKNILSVMGGYVLADEYLSRIGYENVSTAQKIGASALVVAMFGLVEVGKNWVVKKYAQLNPNGWLK